MSESKTAMALIGATVAAGSAYFAYQRYEQRTAPPLPDSPVAVESSQEKAERVQAAFAAAAAVEDAEVQSFIERLQAAVVAGDATAVGGMVSPGRMLDAVAATSGEAIPPFVRSTLESQLRGELIEFFDATVVETTIKRVDRDSEGNLVVYLRQVDHDRILMKSRWWLVAEEGGLRWWDAEDLQLGLRVSTMMAAGISSAMSGGDTSRLEAFIEVLSGLADTDLRNAEEVRILAARIDGLDLTGLPVSFRRLALVSRAALSTALGEPTDALARIDELEQQSLDPLELPVRHYQRAVSCLALERWDEAATAAQHYLDLLGEDAEAYNLLGLAEAGRGNREAAMAAFDAGIADDPQLPDNYAGVASIATDAAQVAERLAKAPELSVLDGAAGDLAAELDTEGLARLLEAAKQAKPEWDSSTWDGSEG
ncbi:MAG: hypothetical protein KC501_36445 [Myxococcales bacterium]|nr:hypothetical protein [Myxococcales bacterium]